MVTPYKPQEDAGCDAADVTDRAPLLKGHGHGLQGGIVTLFSIICEVLIQILALYFSDLLVTNYLCLCSFQMAFGLIFQNLKMFLSYLNI